MCSRGCIECAAKICVECIEKGAAIKCIRCSHWGAFCGKCRSSCYCDPEEIVNRQKQNLKKYKPKVTSKTKKRKIPKKRSSKKIVSNKRKRIKKRRPMK